MTVPEITQDLEAATPTVRAEYDASPDQVWRLWTDPRRFERWWGPPTHPATVTDHDLVPGVAVRYYMTSPEGEKYHGGWRVLAVEPPARLEFEDFFADDAGNEVAELPVARTLVSVDAVDDRSTRMTVVTTYQSTEAMAQALEMGMEEGIRLAMAQIDPILSEDADQNPRPGPR